MPNLSTVRSKLIDKYIQDNSSAEIPDEKLTIMYNGQSNRHQVYRIPIEYLIYNIRNGRFRTELLEKEEELKRKLNPEYEDDAKIIRGLLLNQDENETELLKEDLIKNKQIFPGIITHDGAVINANRRMSILSKLFDDTRDTQYSYLKVARLPEGVNHMDIWRIEAGLQFGRDFRLKYGGVNELLKLREGIKQGLSEKDISVALLGRYKEKQVKEKLEILKLIDSYLIFIDKPGEYHRIHDEGALEKFISGYKAIAGLSSKDNKEKLDLFNILFLIIEKTPIKHLDIRELKDIAENKDALKELKNGYNNNAPRKITAEKINENFKTAFEISKSKKQADKPNYLLKTALSNLNNVDPKSNKLKELEIQTLLSEISARIKLLIQSSK